MTDGPLEQLLEPSAPALPAALQTIDGPAGAFVLSKCEPTRLACRRDLAEPPSWPSRGWGHSGRGARARNPVEHVDRPHVGDGSQTLGPDREQARGLLREADQSSPRDRASLPAGPPGLRVSEALGLHRRQRRHHPRASHLVGNAKRGRRQELPSPAPSPSRSWPAHERVGPASALADRQRAANGRHTAPPEPPPARQAWLPGPSRPNAARAVALRTTVHQADQTDTHWSSVPPCGCWTARGGWRRGCLRGSGGWCARA